MRKLAIASTLAVLVAMPSAAAAARRLSVSHAHAAIRASVAEMHPTSVSFTSCDRRSRTVVGCWTQLTNAEVGIEIENETDGSIIEPDGTELYFVVRLAHGHAVVDQEL